MNTAVFLDTKTFADTVDLSPIKTVVDQLICFDFTSQNQIIERCQTAEILITNKVIISADIIQQLPQLKLICVAATGVNNIDLTACQQHKVTVCNVTHYAANAVAQYVFSQLLNYYEQLDKQLAQVKAGYWPKSTSFCLHGASIEELAGKTLAICGFGDLGQKVAKIAQAFELNVLILERPNATVIRENRVPFEQGIQVADIVSIHCPLTDDTFHLFDQATLSLMKKGSVLVNTARGAIVDNQALIDALSQQHLAAAFIDVLDEEPPRQDHPLLNSQLSNLFITAHIAWASRQAQQRLIDTIASNIKAFLTGELQNRLV